MLSVQRQNRFKFTNFFVESLIFDSIFDFDVFADNTL